MWEHTAGVRVRSQRGLRLAVLGGRPAAGEASEVDLLHSTGKQPGAFAGVFCHHRASKGLSKSSQVIRTTVPFSSICKTS